MEMVGGVELLEVADLRCPKEGPKPNGFGVSGFFPLACLGIYAHKPGSLWRRVEGSAFRGVSGFGFRALGFRIRAQGFDFGISDLRPKP